MPLLTEAQVKTFKPQKKTNYSDGNGLFLVVDPKVNNGGRYFIGRMRYPASRNGKQIEIRIGPYGKDSGRRSLKEARIAWDEIKSWSKASGKDPRDKKKAELEATECWANSPSLLDYAEEYLSICKLRELKEDTIKDYRNILNNIILPELGPTTKIKDYTFEKSRLKVIEVAEIVARRGAKSHAVRTLMVMRQMFNLAISDGHITGDNPAMSSPRLKRPKTIHHPHLEGEAIRTFLEVLERYENKNEMRTLAIKWTLMNMLRVSASVSARWDQIDTMKMVWTIPGTQKGIKRTANHSDIEHTVPITKEMKSLINRMRNINGHREHMFWSIRKGKYQHINPYGLNTTLVRLGYSKLLDVHGIRRTAVTELAKLGHDFNKTSKVLGHLDKAETSVQAKLRKAYNAYEDPMLEQKYEVLKAWHKRLVELGMTV